MGYGYIIHIGVYVVKESKNKSQPHGLTLSLLLHIGKPLYGLCKAFDGLVGITVLNAVADTMLDMSLEDDLAAAV